MHRLYLLLTVGLLGVVVVALNGGHGDSAVAARSGGGKVVCKFTKVRRGKLAVVCPASKIRGARGRRGPAGPAGPPGPAGAPGGAGSGVNLNFSAYLPANQTKELSVAGFNVTAASNGAGACEPIRLRPSVGSRVAVGSGAEFTSLSANASKTLTNGKNSTMFTVVANDGSRTASGIVGSITVGNVCLVSGYVTGF